MTSSETCIVETQGDTELPNDTPEVEENSSSDFEFTDDDEDFEVSSFSSMSDSSHEEEEAMDPPSKKVKNVEQRQYNWEKVSGTSSELFPIEKIRQLTDSEEVCNWDKESSSPIKYFTRYFSDTVLSLIVRASNLNAAETSHKLELCMLELKAFIGLLVIMGFHKLPSIRNYWNCDSNFSVPRVSLVMNVKRFCKILRYLCACGDVSGNSGSNRDEFYMMSSLMDHFNERSGQVRGQPQWLSLDITKLDRHYCRREMRSKIIGLCCSKTGYLYNFCLLTSKRYNENKVVLDLVSPINDSKCGLVLNKRFVNFPLIEKLNEKKIFACAEVSQDLPGFPRQLRSDQPMDEDFDYRQSEDFSITKWKNKQKWVWILSVLHDPHQKKNVLKKSSKTTSALVEYPESVLDYNKHRYGVKRFENSRIKYSTSWKSRDKSIKLFYYLLDASIVNSYILYKDAWGRLKNKEGATLLSPLEFRSRLADSLIGNYVGRRRPARAPILQQLKKNSTTAVGVSNEIRLTHVGKHMPIVSTRRRCALCSTKGKPKRSTISCTYCQVGLCLNCFAAFHTEIS